jgi:hypothetical protein
MLASAGGGSPVQSLAPVSVVASLRKRQRPVCRGAADRAVLLYGLSTLGVWELALVDQEGPVPAAALAF